jgi:hypothetical protein
LGITLTDTPASQEAGAGTLGEQLSFSTSAIADNLPEVVDTIEQAVRRLGGPAKLA